MAEIGKSISPGRAKELSVGRANFGTKLGSELECSTCGQCVVPGFPHACNSTDNAAPTGPKGSSGVSLK